MAVRVRKVRVHEVAEVGRGRDTVLVVRLWLVVEVRVLPHHVERTGGQVTGG
jgi:hypothetical protein